MKTPWFNIIGIYLISAGAGWLPGVRAQQSAPSMSIQLLANKEIALTLTAQAGSRFRIEATADLRDWKPLTTLSGGASGSVQFTDSAAPYLSERYYRVQQLAEPSALTGDHLATADGDVIFHPLFHASFVMSWNGKTIYNDPDDDPAYLATYQ